jgi:hypothetical protein
MIRHRLRKRGRVPNRGQDAQSDFIELLKRLQLTCEKRKMAQGQVDELRALLAAF